MITCKNKTEREALVKRMVYLAYQASSVQGAGCLRAIDYATEEEVWDQAYNEKDYAVKRSAVNKVHCDYVFGRMMKWSCEWHRDTIFFLTHNFVRDYQSFCKKYPGNESLAKAAIELLGIDALVED